MPPGVSEIIYALSASRYPNCAMCSTVTELKTNQTKRERERETGRGEVGGGDKIILYYTRIKVKAQVGFFSFFLQICP